MLKCVIDDTQANKELGRRVRSWKAAYLREVSRREELETELRQVQQVRRKAPKIVTDIFFVIAIPQFREHKIF